MADLKPYINKAADGTPLTAREAYEAFTIMMSGQATPAQIGGFLMALRIRGETIDEISGAVDAMREKMLPVQGVEGAIDIVGTGGDQSGSYNISTASALVVAGCGVPVAKHGNRALSSRSGAADALKTLGVNIDAAPETIARCLAQTGLCFMFAPTHHAAMRHVGPARVELGTRTIFNLLGPLANPAGAAKQLIGVFSPQWVEPVALTLQRLGSQSFWVVHGNGMDELTTAGETQVAALKNGEISTFTLAPEDAGLPRVDCRVLKGGTPEENAAALLHVLEGEKSAYRDIVLFNSAAALIIADKAKDLHEGVALAAQSIDSGAAKARLQHLIKVSNSDGQRQ
ncbi:MAG: Anthranilate phosphoribosyltransferase [Candidatus Tokpelaia hoelldobleri]|uniref:Anthranilate phosphoribosyltransferase n=1 Tax=Candidatus Tokpelaia hoelldobleri TaxID=1902579 RepID=A0A1U9JU29_9HYPH|nr:MAG: Anthranilate phosphoribosyltransferase [Candidatus Tokpelaia hoelldoblerii]